MRESEGKEGGFLGRGLYGNAPQVLKASMRLCIYATIEPQ